MKRIYSIASPSLSTTNEQVDFRWQSKKSKYLAVNYDNVVVVYDRHGEQVDQINLFGYGIFLKFALNKLALVIFSIL